MGQGLLWPDPLIQLNPSFLPGSSIDELVAEGTLETECSRIFRRDKDRSQSKELRLHQHQTEAVRLADSRVDYVLTTGTGSGKSLAYIIPIVNHVLRNGPSIGIQAIVVYPMNALANSQLGELEKFLSAGYPNGRGPVTFARYTGQESDERRQEIMANPPHIILTNYVMLELILTRSTERALVAAARNLQFLVLDELHTYRGRQGADVALLIRRLKQATQASGMICVGTSATLSSVGNSDQQKQEVAEVASKLFGTVVAAESVIGETLKPTTVGDVNQPGFAVSLREKVANFQPVTSYQELISDPISIWIEDTFGVYTETETERLIRRIPRSLVGPTGAAEELSQLTELQRSDCEYAIQQTLLAGYRILDPLTGFPAFAFRLHQFISRTGDVYASFQPESDRYLTLQAQQYVPEEANVRNRLLLPVVFCRECGQEYYSVKCQTVEGDDWQSASFAGREFFNREDEGDTGGYLYHSSDNPWPTDQEKVLSRLPSEWTEINHGSVTIRRIRRKWLPQNLKVGTEGNVTENGLDCSFIKTPFRFCLQCGVSYGFEQRSEFSKLSSLGTEGRSTATTILSLSTILQLGELDGISARAKKLLSFTDNRQDASLQAGHLNDFVEIGVLRAALYSAVRQAGQDGIRHQELTVRVFEALNLPVEAYSIGTDIRYAALDQTRRAVREVLGYRLYQDLRRGWRLTAPNLEQCGLLEIDYLSLSELSSDHQVWQDRHPALATASSETRQAICRTLLDYMRRELAIRVDYLDSTYQEQIQQSSRQRLNDKWALAEEEVLVPAVILYHRESGSASQQRGARQLSLSSRSGYGRYMRRPATFPDYNQHIDSQESEEIIRHLLSNLEMAGLIQTVDQGQGGTGFQLVADSMIWKAGAGETVFHDVIRVPNPSSEQPIPNQFFVQYYTEIAQLMAGIEAHEHTAQVPPLLRQQREDDFREAKLPILYCSPTMELGVDIAELNVVNLRNVPPTPANYAQRSGRAGRSGQPALVFSYCSTYSSHDRYFFKRPADMVSGVVSPPRLDLANEDLLKSHIQAIWLANSGLSLGRNLTEILEVGGDRPGLELKPHIIDSLDDSTHRQKTIVDAQYVLASIQSELEEADWYHTGWLEEVISNLKLSFELSCERWRGLYSAALEQAKVQSQIIQDASRSPQDKRIAKQLRREAESQLSILTETTNIIQSDFYSYRYFASQGFLPGYNFPRLPLSAYIPGRRQRDEMLSRPRFLAVSEFGPGAIIYHEGARYQITRAILPVQESVNSSPEQSNRLASQQIKQCEHCGCVHPITDGSGPDLCQFCQRELSFPLSNLFRLQNVVTRRREKINSDEEERTRIGYQIQTGFKFNAGHQQLASRQAELEFSDEEGQRLPVAKLTYASNAEIWRVNLGWRNRSSPAEQGFLINSEKGTWISKSQAESDRNNGPEVGSDSVQRVIPYVHDRRNCLLVQLVQPADESVMASLQAALKVAIQVCYQLEDNELAVDALPSSFDRKMIMFYESAEGGAGVLRQLVREAESWNQIASKALEICHFEPSTGADLHRADTASENCESACYDCLMNYANQRDHILLDRRLIKDILLQLANSSITSSPIEQPRRQHLKALVSQSASSLERQWLAYLEQQQLHLPTKAQFLIAEAGTRPDFFYQDHFTVIYVDGPAHQYPERQQRDRQQEEDLQDLGYAVIRFGHRDDWASIFAQYPNIFGGA